MKISKTKKVIAFVIAITFFSFYANANFQVAGGFSVQQRTEVIQTSQGGTLQLVEKAYKFNLGSNADGNVLINKETSKTK